MHGINYYIFIRSGAGSRKSEVASDFGLPASDFGTRFVFYLLVKFILCCFLISLAHSSFSQQNKIDSLLVIIKNDNEDSAKVNHLTQLAILYMNKGENSLSLKTFKNGLTILERMEENVSKNQFHNSIKKQKADIISSMGTIYKNKGDFYNAMDYYKNALRLAEELSDKDLVTIYSSHIGVVYKIIGNYPKALEYYLRALKIDEELGHEKDAARHLSNIGGIYYQLKDYIKALEYVFKSLAIHEKLENKKSVALCYGNIGNIYVDQKEYNKALEYEFKALKIYEELGSKANVATILGNIGAAYFNMGEYTKALESYLSAIDKTRETGDKVLLTTQLGGIGSVYLSLKKYKEAEVYFLEAITICDKLRLVEQKIQIEQALSELYEKLGKHKLSHKHYKLYVLLKDSIFSMEKEEDITRKEMNYEFEKKEADLLADHEKRIAITEATKQKQRRVIIAVISGLLLLSVILIVNIRSLQITRKQKIIIEAQKEISVTQKQMVEEQKQIIETKQKQILDSIHYAKTIQEAVMTSNSYINQYFGKDYFVLFKPKDIVSGDFYWALQHHNKFYIITADSTGHGVPGAFMSLLNISFLNEAIVERGIKEPHEIFNYVRNEIIKAINPENAETEKRDGMDAVLCCYDFEKMELHFAAANNPLWLLRNGEITEYKADKMPVGKYDGEMKPFTLQKILLQKEDIVYTITDGYADQFGGPANKKIGKKALRGQLIAGSTRPMNEQKEILLKTFNDWKGNQEEQIDDVCIMGVKI